MKKIIVLLALGFFFLGCTKENTTGFASKWEGGYFVVGYALSGSLIFDDDGFCSYNLGYFKSGTLSYKKNGNIIQFNKSLEALQNIPVSLAGDIVYLHKLNDYGILEEDGTKLRIKGTIESKSSGEVSESFWLFTRKVE